MVLCTSSSLISVIPKSKFLEWIESTLPGHKFDIRDFESRAYLVPDCDTQQGCEEWLIENSQQIFEEELREYDPSTKHWPPVRDPDNIWDYFMFIQNSQRGPIAGRLFYPGHQGLISKFGLNRLFLLPFAGVAQLVRAQDS
jgi:hypothetical protein